MRQFFNDILIQMKGIWARLEGQQRLVVGAVLLATVVGLGGMVWFAGQPSYETIFTAESADEMQRAQQALGQAGISYKTDDTGRSFQVERSKVAQANNVIGMENLTGTQPVGLSSSNMLEDAATKQWRLDSVSRGQAQAAISKLDGVMDVTVTASRPQRLIAFRDNALQNRASATVLLRLRGGVNFEATARSAASIASSQLMVPKENIEVVSAIGGHRWSYNPDREGSGGSSEFLELQRNMSDARTRIAQQRLDQMWPGSTSVNVHVELEPKWEVRTEKVLPPEPLVKSEDSTKDTTDNPSANADVVGSSSKNEKKTKEYVTEIGTRRTGQMMPAIKRISVAVLYDEQVVTVTDIELTKVVKSIVGWDSSRDEDDSFSLLKGTFAPPVEMSAPESGPGMGEVAAQWAPMIGQVLGVLVVVMFLRGLFKRSRRPVDEDVSLEPETPEEDLAPEEQQKRMRREIERSIAADPAALAKMLESWLMEQRA
ncbi:MAG: flagellar biosynthesis/type III secretory pathway M-ring protein FliF/YscJ [Planctomycetota bacterium]|jgi:flagellar biosynthesis/type III secretory pathway M-ring protein FliF/YscJ